VVLGTLLNSYPRIGDQPAEQVLRRALAAADRGEAGAGGAVPAGSGAVAAAEDAMTRRAIDEQAAAGLDLLTDGQVRWHDPLSHLARGLAGFRLGGLLRYFDTNTYYRQPEAAAPIGRERPILVEAWRFAAAAAAPRPVKAIVTGPLTLARLSLDRRGRAAAADLALEVAAALGGELRDLEAAGARVIQIDEPAIARRPRELPALRAALSRTLDGVRKARIILSTSFGDATPILRDLAALPVAVLGFDLLAAGGDAPSLRAVLPRDRGLLLGVVDGRNTRLEDPRATFDRLLRPILPALREITAAGHEIHLAPNHGLEFLPRGVARAKLTVVAGLRDRLREALP
jgi:5-methyltetrahydropteroyltriglutamate--homocysteine methyltransferase